MIFDSRNSINHKRRKTGLDMYDNKGEVDLDKLGENTQREMAKKFQVFKKNSLDPAKDH